MKTIIGLIVLWPLAGFLLNGLGRNIWSKKTIASQATGYIFALSPEQIQNSPRSNGLIFSLSKYGNVLI